MTDEDDFLAEARRNWRAQDAEIGSVGVRLRYGRLYSQAMLWMELAAGLVALLVGLGGLWIGSQRPDGMLVISGLVLLVVVPPLCWLTWKARRAEPRWDREDPESILRGMIAHSRTIRDLMRLVRWQGMILLGLAAALWAATPFGFVRQTPHLIQATVLFGIAAACCFVWAWWRERGADRERERCERLLEEFS